MRPFGRAAVVGLSLILIWFEDSVHQNNKDILVQSLNDLLMCKKKRATLLVVITTQKW